MIIDTSKGLKMEIEDGGHPLFRGVQVFSDPQEAFQDAKVLSQLGCVHIAMVSHIFYRA